MFFEYSSLTKIDLSYSKAIKVINTERMFYGCLSLKKENILTRDSRILEEF